jgi:hypothetical protein
MASADMYAILADTLENFIDEKSLSEGRFPASFSRATCFQKVSSKR